MKTLVIGGTGKVGGAAVAYLRAEGHEVQSAARGHGRGHRGGHGGGHGDVTLDMRDARAVEAAARGYDAAFFITPLGPDETEIGLAVHAALVAAGVARIGYLAIHNLDAMRAIPHFETKRPIRDAVLARDGGVVVAPNFFFQNDALALPAIVHAGVYPLPIGSTGVFSVDADDIGRAVARTLSLGDWDGQEVPVCGTERLTGPAIAANWTLAAGRAVAYGGDDAVGFVAMLRTQMPPEAMTDWIADDMRTMMEVTQRVGCLATDADIAASRAAIGREPRTHLDFAMDLIRKEAP